MGQVLTLTDCVVRRRGWSLGPITWSLPTGVTAVVGENGAGKSTFLRVAAGCQRPTQGAVVGSSQVAYLPQHVDFPYGVTCLEMVSYAGGLAGVASDLAEASREALSHVGLLARAEVRARSLSGGQQRRLALAQLMVGSPTGILLDEPFSGVDPIQRETLVEWIGRTASTVPIVVTTHDIDAVLGMADRVMVFHQGQIVAQEDCAEDGLASGSDVRDLMRRESA